MKTSELIGKPLNYAVATYENVEFDEQGSPIWFDSDGLNAERVEYSPSTDWSQGGPIIERDGVNLSQEFGGSEGSFAKPTGWMARIYKLGGPINPTGYRGPTPLIAAMRCLVASKLGDEVEIPEELL